MYFNPNIFLPQLYSFKNSFLFFFKEREKLKHIFFLLLGIVFFIGIFLLSKFIVLKVLSIDIIGEIVARRILSMLFMTIFFMVFFSSIITSLTSFYTADDLRIINTLPLGFESIFFSRILRSFLNSSWMPIGFILPVIYGFCSAFNAHPLIHIYSSFLLIFFFIIPVSMGSIFITIIVRLFPATKIKEILIIIGITAFSLLYIWFRLFQPERFLNPDGLSTMIEFIVRFDLPLSILIPSTWITELIFGLIKNSSLNLIELTALISTSVSSLFIASLFIEKLYLEAFSRSQEGKKGKTVKNTLTIKIVNLLPLPKLSRVIIQKDFLEFIRQPSQWSQLILLFALLVVYIYNFKYFRNIQLTGIISQWGLYFLNMGLCGLVIAALGARFIYPAISLERNSFYILRVAPVSMKRFVYSKFFIYSIPLTLTSVIITIVSNLILRSSTEYFIISTIMSLIIAITISGLGISIGAIYPNFREIDPASIPASVGGIIYMISSMSTIILLIALTIWPTAFIRFPDYAARSGIKVYLISGLNIGLIIAILLFSTLFLLNYAARRLEDYEQ